MPRQLLIDDEIQFRNKTHAANVKGEMQEGKVHFHDHFTDDTLSTDKWLATVTSHTIAVSHSTYRHTALFTTDTTDNECSYLSTPLCWEDDLYVVVEAKILVSDVSAVGLFFGLADATYYTTPDMAIDYAGGTYAAAATNAVGIVMDGDDTVNGASSIMATSVKATVKATAVDSSTDWADAAWHTLRIELDPDAKAIFYLDGSAFATIAAAYTSGTAMCVQVAVANRGTAAETVYVDRVDAWQDEE